MAGTGQGELERAPAGAVGVRAQGVESEKHEDGSRSSGLHADEDVPLDLLLGDQHRRRVGLVDELRLAEQLADGEETVDVGAEAHHAAQPERLLPGLARSSPSLRRNGPRRLG